MRKGTYAKLPLMDTMNGEGVSQAMHDATPGSAEMTDACARAKVERERSGQPGAMPGMLSGMGRMMHGDMMDGMHDPMGRGH